MKSFVIIFVGLLLGGCQTVQVETPRSADPVVLQKRFLSVAQIKPGLTRQEVSGLLGKDVVTGYALSDENAQTYQPIVTANPYRTETVQKGRAVYAVDYYFVGIKSADGAVSDDELVPIIYQNDRVVGLGWDYLNQRVKGK